MSVESMEPRQMLSGATPVFRYQFNEGSGTTVTDTGDNGANPKNNGTLVGTVIPTWVAGPSGNAGDFALQFTNAKNPNNAGDPYYDHKVTGAVMTDAANSTGPYNEGLVQLSNNVDPVTPVATTPDLSSVLNGNASLAAWVKTTATGDNNTWAAPSITGAEGRGLVNDIRWGYLDASGHIGIAAGDAGGVLSSTAINDGTWHLVVLSRSQTTAQMTVYVDGALSGQATRTNNGAAGPLACHFNVIGGATDTGGGNVATIEGYNVFNGALDDVRVFDHVLSLAEVQALLPTATTAPAAPTNVAASLVSGLVKVTWTDNATNELSFLIERTTADPSNPANPDNTKWAQVGAGGAVSGSGQQGTFTDVSSAYSGAKFFYRVRAFNSFNGGSFSAYGTTATGVTLPVAAPVDRYQFNEGAGSTTTADSGTPGGKTGTLSANPPTVVTGPNGDPALSFNGTDNSVDVATDLSPVLANNASVAAWVKTTAGGSGAIVGTEIGSAPIALRWGYLDGQGHIGVGVGTAAGVFSGSAINDNQWHLVVMTRDTGSGQVKIYVDGVLEKTAISETGSKIAQFMRIGATTNVGENGAPNGGYTFFNGQLDDVRLYNSVLSQQDIYGLLPPTTHAPAAPTNLAGAANGAVVSLSWKDQADNEFSYLILRSENPNGPFDQIASTRGPAGTGSTVNFIDTTVTSGHTYYYEVEAVNSFNGGSISAPAGPITVSFVAGKGLGAEGHYYNQSYWAGTPTVNTLVGAVDLHWDTTPDPRITNGGRASTIFTGKIKSNEAGSYQFVSNTDDDGYLYVNGVLVSRDPLAHGEQDATLLAPINLAADTYYNFVLLQNNSGGAAGAHLKWITPSMQAASNFSPIVIPPTNLFTEMDTPAAPTAFALDPNLPATAHTVSFTFTHNNNAVVHFLLQRSSDNGVTWTTVNQTDPGGASANGDGTTTPAGNLTIEDDSAVPGETYRYRLVAMNFDHTSTPLVLGAPVTVPSANPQGSGVQVHYFNGELVTQAKDNDPRNFAASGIGPSGYLSSSSGTVDFDYFANSPDGTLYPDLPRIHVDSFTTAWTGKILTDGAGSYTFSLNADDVAVMYVNGVKVAQTGAASTPLTLAANTAYNFVILHNEFTGNANIHALWTEPGQPVAVPIPAGNVGANGGFLQVMSTPYQQTVSPTGVLTENTSGSAAAALASSAPVVGSGVNLTWTDQSLSELWFEVQRTVPDSANANNPDNTKWAPVGYAGMNIGSFNDATAAAGSKYFYRVRGGNYDANGPFSNVVSGVGQNFIVNGTAGNDTITLKQNPDGIHIDVTMGGTTAQALITDPAGVTINSGGGSDTVVLDATNGNPLPNLLTLNGSLTVNGPLNIGPGQSVVVGHSAANGGATLDLQGLTIDPTGKLNLNNNVLKVHYGSGATPIAAISGYLATGRAGGAWNGPGIDSGNAGGSTALGVNDVPGTVTVKYTRNGDANLDGIVDFNDLVALAQHYNVNGGQYWFNGDFTYDKNVDFNDLVVLAQNYNQSLASPAVSALPVSAAALASTLPFKPVAAAPKPVAKPIVKPAIKPAAKPTVASVFAQRPLLRPQSRSTSIIGDVLEKRPKGATALFQ